MFSIRMIVSVCLALLAQSLGLKAMEVTSCENSIINNCRCAMPIMASRLSSTDIDILVRAWTEIRSADSRQQTRFFSDHATRLLPISLRYAEIKYLIGFKCGVLAFDDE